MQPMFHFIFCIRRFIFALEIAFLFQNLSFQVMLMLFMSSLNVAYLVFYLPFRENLMNFLEVFNEYTIVICLYMCFTFTDFVSDPRMKHICGWVLIGTVLFNISLNILVVMGSSVLQIYKSV